MASRSVSSDSDQSSHPERSMTAEPSGYKVRSSVHSDSETAEKRPTKGGGGGDGPSLREAHASSSATSARRGPGCAFIASTARSDSDTRCVRSTLPLAMRRASAFSSSAALRSARPELMSASAPMSTQLPSMNPPSWSPLRPEQSVDRAVGQFALRGQPTRSNGPLVGEAQLVEQTAGAVIARVDVRCHPRELRMNGEGLGQDRPDRLSGEAETPVI